MRKFNRIKHASTYPKQSILEEEKIQEEEKSLYLVAANGEESENKKLEVSSSQYSFMKSACILQAVVYFVLFGTLVFSGIEGNNAKVRNYELFIQQAEFNKSNLVNRSIRDYAKFYNGSLRRADLECKVAKLDLYGWNNMSFMDTMLYSYSIISTIGWGLRFPKSILCKAFTLVYAIIGIPIVSFLIGCIVKLMKSDERGLKASVFVRRRFGNYKIFAAFCIKLGVVYTVLQGYLATKMVYAYSDDEDTKKIYTKVGYSRVWSLTEGIYCYIINGMTTIGFGEQHIFGPGSKYAVRRFLSMLFQIFLLVLAIALMELGFEVVTDYFDRSLEKKMEKTYQKVDSMKPITYSSASNGATNCNGPCNGSAIKAPPDKVMIQGRVVIRESSKSWLNVVLRP